jgi:hypothetical protein
MAIQDMDHVFVDRDYRFGVVVDRLGTGGPIKLASGHVLPGEFMYDGYTIVMGKETRLRGPEILHLFRHEVLMVHTADGEWVSRFGFKEGDEGLREVLGPEACDCSPIELDADARRVEHWNTAELGLDPDKATLRKVNAVVTRDKQGAGNRSTQHLPAPA